jgi:hypothetical protein
MHELPAAEVLPYAAPRRRRYTGLNIAVAAASVVLLAIFYVGLAPSIASFAFDYTRNIPLSEAITGVTRVSPRALLTDPYTMPQVYFMPTAIATLAAFVFLRRSPRKLAVAVFAIAFPVFLVRNVAFYLFSPVAFFLAVPAALLGRCDGEVWSEGIVAIGALGGWMLLWIVVAARLLWTSRGRPAD